MKWRNKLVSLFHQAWGHCKESPEYTKDTWLQLEREIDDLHRGVPVATTPPSREEIALAIHEFAREINESLARSLSKWGWVPATQIQVPILEPTNIERNWGEVHSHDLDEATWNCRRCGVHLPASEHDPNPGPCIARTPEPSAPEECDCDVGALLEPGVEYSDGQIVPCPDCGFPWMVSCDAENPPHLMDADEEPRRPRRPRAPEPTENGAPIRDAQGRPAKRVFDGSYGAGAFLIKSGEFGAVKDADVEPERACSICGKLLFDGTSVQWTPRGLAHAFHGTEEPGTT